MYLQIIVTLRYGVYNICDLATMHIMLHVHSPPPGMFTGHIMIILDITLLAIDKDSSVLHLHNKDPHSGGEPLFII